MLVFELASADRLASTCAAQRTDAGLRTMTVLPPALHQVLLLAQTLLCVQTICSCRPTLGFSS